MNTPRVIGRWTIALLCCTGCATTLPEQQVERGLYRDLHKQVALRESDDWVVDRVEIEQATETAMVSVCQVAPEHRQDLLSWLKLRIAEEGGQARAIYEREGETSRFERVRRLERVKLLLEHTSYLARDECPYWMEPDPSFAGVQSDEARFVLMADSMGGGALFVTDDGAELGGGGGGRLLLGYGLLPRWTAALGIEVGGSATLGSSGGGDRTLGANVAGAVPLLMRYHAGSRLVDLEAALTTRWRGGEARWPPGLRVTVGYGLSARRVGGLMPYGLLYVGYEVVPPDDGPADARLSTMHVIWLGTKVGINWDP